MSRLCSIERFRWQGLVFETHVKMKAPRSKLRGIKTPKGKTRHIGNEASFGESHPFTIERTEGRYVARTRLGIEDCIVTDGNSEDEALRRHWQTLPLALLARMWGW